MSTGVTQQFLCNQCGHTVTPIPLFITTVLICPNCTSTHLELLQNPNPNPTNNSVDSNQFVVSGAGDSAAVRVGDFWLLDEPVDDFFDELEFDDELFQQLNGSPPASQAAVEALSSVTISEEMDGSGVSLCAICKESFCVGDVVKELPCKHVFHGDCILPWLRIHNSCPVCRFKLPTNDVKYENRTRGASQGESSNGRDGNHGDGDGSAGGHTENVD